MSCNLVSFSYIHGYGHSFPHIRPHSGTNKSYGKPDKSHVPQGMAVGFSASGRDTSGDTDSYGHRFISPHAMRRSRESNSKTLGLRSNRFTGDVPASFLRCFHTIVLDALVGHPAFGKGMDSFGKRLDRAQEEIKSPKISREAA
jgi:hypothetical protein